MDSLELLDFSSFIIFSDDPWSLLVSFCQLFKLLLVVQCCNVICEWPLKPYYTMLRSPVSRIKFNTHSPEWSSCMATCPKYNRAMVPFFTDKAELDQLMEWILNVRLDPDNTPYPGLLGSTSIWIPIRFVR